MKMTESLITEWLADCADLSPTELHTFANTLSQDNEIVRALYAVLDERSKYSQLVDTVCNQLYGFYRSREIELQRFTLQFLPTLIYIYLNSVAHGDKKSCRTVETLLIGLYNLEVVDDSGQPKAVSFRLPSLAMPSIYHEVRYERITPMSLAPASLTESALRRLEECNTKLVSWGPLPQVEALNAQNRLKVMTALLFVYNQQLSRLDKSALEQLCKVATKLVTQGFTKPGHHQRSSYGSDSSFVPRLLPRIPVSAQFLLEFLHAIYFAMYNDCWYVGSQALEDIHNRACFEAYPDVMLVTNAIRNSSSSGASGQPGDGPMGISVALSPATPTVTVSKSMITNASFRTKKLPDDLEEELFGVTEPQTVNIQQQQQPAVSAIRHRTWPWRHSQQNSPDEEDIGQNKANSSSSKDSSRRESINSSQGSPSKASPKKKKDEQSKKTDPNSTRDSVPRRLRKESKERSVSPSESRMSAGARLYRVLEERTLDEVLGESVNLYIGNSRPVSLCSTAALSTNDIPIQAAKDDSGGEGKGNLVSITEEQETGDPSRAGSLRQPKDSKGTSKISNFPGLGKKPKDRDGKSAKNGYVTNIDKDKKLGSQIPSKENIRGSRSVLNNDTQEIESSVNGSSSRKKNSAMENNSSVSDSSITLLENERLVLVSETVENTNADTPLTLRNPSESDSINNSVQVSSV